MKKIISVLLVCVLVFALASCASHKHKKNNDAAGTASAMNVEEIKTDCVPVSYFMDITLDDKENTVGGTCEVEIRNESETALDKICFRLFSASITDGSVLSAAREKKSGTDLSVKPSKDDSVIYIYLGEFSLEPEESLSVEVDFVSVIPERADRFGYYVQNEDSKLYNLTFCFPQIAFFDNGKWFEEPYTETGETSYNPMSDYKVVFNAPAEYKVLGSGKSVTEEGKTEFTADNIREMAITACNFGKIKTISKNNITFNFLDIDYPYTDTEYQTLQLSLIEEVVIESCEIFSKKVGDYIYDELDVIPMIMDNHGGMEMPGLVYIAIPRPDSITPDTVGYLAEEVFRSSAHEVGHQWFFCAVGNDQYNESWLDESLTSFLEAYYCSNNSKGSAVMKRINIRYNATYDSAIDYFDGYESFSEESYINLPVKSYSVTDYGNIVYFNGAMFFEKLRTKMGDYDFFRVLKKWYSDNLNGIGSSAELVKIILEFDDSDEVKTIINDFISDDYLR